MSETRLEKVEKIIGAIEEYKEAVNYDENEISFIELEIKGKEIEIEGQRKVYDNLFEMAKLASGTDKSFADRMLVEADKLRNLEKQLERLEKQKSDSLKKSKELEKKQENLDKYIETLKREKEKVNEKIKEYTSKISVNNKKIKELKEKENKSIDEVEELNKLISERESFKKDRKSLMKELEDINKALDTDKILEEYKAKNKQDKDKNQEKEEITPDKQRRDNQARENDGAKGDDNQARGNGGAKGNNNQARGNDGAKGNDNQTRENGGAKGNNNQARGNDGAKSDDNQARGNDESKGDGYEDISSSSYGKMLNDYKMLLDMYNQDLEMLYDLQKKYENNEIDYSEYEKHADYMVERYRTIQEEYKKVKFWFEKEKQKSNTQTNKENKENIEKQWHPGLSQEEIDDAIQRGIYEPEGQEYEQFLNEHGLKPIKNSEERKNENKENVEKQWHPGLSQEEIDDAIQRGIDEPEGQEYEQFLIEHGLKPIKGNEGKENNQDVEEPEKPEQPMMILEKDEKVSQTGENLALVKSGLQIFREQFNQMPEIKNRHTAAERFKIVAPLLTTAGICSCAIPVVGPFIGIPVAATSAILRPIIYRATGQKKLEKQIEDQFKGMDEEEFDRMVEFLTEEKIQDLKPNAVILNALNKVMQERTKKKESELKDEMVKLKKQREELLLIDMSSLTKQEQEELNSRFGEINKRIIEIREDKVPKLERELKDIKRGRDRVSATYKGNLKTRFNILARRNSTTERYAPAINAYADAEKARDDAMILGNQREGSEQDKKMENVGKEYTYTNKFGIQISQFNMRDGLVRKISDLKDQTIRRICSLTTLGVGSAIVWKNHVQINKAMENNETSFNRIINEHNGQVRGAQETVSGIDQGTVQSVADGHVTDAAAQAEHTIVNNLGRTSAQGYREADALAQNDIAEVASGSKITGNKVSEMMQKLAEVVRSRAEIAGRYAESAQNANLSPNAVDHGAQFAYTSNAGTQNEATAHLFDKMSDLIKKVENMAIIDAKFEKVKSSLLGPAIMACGTILDRARSRIENKKEENYNKTMNTPDKTEEQDITTDNDAR